jgi:anti-sigma B factor antagonist
MPIELATIGFEDAERATVATIDGEVDMSNADRLLDELMGRVGSAPWLVIDLTTCSYLDSAGLRAVARVDLRCREVGAGLRLVVDPAGAVDRALTMTRMSEVLTVDRSLSDALESAFGDVDRGRANDEGANADVGGPDARGDGP